jgi:hypothetical protein
MTKKYRLVNFEVWAVASGKHEHRDIVPPRARLRLTVIRASEYQVLGHKPLTACDVSVTSFTRGQV